MARPLETTPILLNKDADRLFKEAEKAVHLTSAKKKELDKYRALYKKFSARRRPRI